MVTLDALQKSRWQNLSMGQLWIVYSTNWAFTKSGKKKGRSPVCQKVNTANRGKKAPWPDKTKVSFSFLFFLFLFLIFKALCLAKKKKKEHCCRVAVLQQGSGSSLVRVDGKLNTGKAWKKMSWMLQKTWDWEESCNGFNQRIVRVAGHKLILSFFQFLDKQVWPTQGSRMQMHNTLFTSAFASNFENNFTMMCYFVLADCIKSEFKKKNHWS